MDPSTGSRRARAVRDRLRREIVAGRWPIGSQVPTEPELVELLQVGRTTIREAVRSLASLGMLETLPGRGTFVRSRTPVSPVLRDYLADYSPADLLVLRRSLELEATRLAAIRRTPADLELLREAHDHPSDPDRVQVEEGRTPGQFHALVLAASGSPLLQDAWAGLMAAMRQVVSRGRIRFGTGADARRDEHAELLAALVAGDPQRAVLAMQEHLRGDLIAVEPGD